MAGLALIQRILDFVITMMIQNVKDKGGSHYVVPMVRMCLNDKEGDIVSP